MIVALNPQAKVFRFQCQNFFLNRTTQPYAVVPEETDWEAIRKALREGVLLDVTNSQKSIETDGQILNPVESQTTGKMAFVSTDGTVIIPATEEEQKELEAKASRIIVPRDWRSIRT